MECSFDNFQLKVFTWVNGSDPEFQRQLQHSTEDPNLIKTHKDDLKSQRCTAVFANAITGQIFAIFIAFSIDFQGKAELFVWKKSRISRRKARFLRN